MLVLPCSCVTPLSFLSLRCTYLVLSSHSCKVNSEFISQLEPKLSVQVPTAVQMR